MNKKRASIWISVVTGLGVAVLLLVAGSTAAGSPPELQTADQASAAALAAASWNSGWFNVAPGSSVTLTHNVGGNPDDYVVEMWFSDVAGGGYGINTKGFGGFEAGGQFFGAAWQNLTDSTVQVVRYANDTFADFIRVRIWIPDSLPDYCSDWTSIGLGQTRTFTHSLGGDVNDYTARVVFSSTLVGVNARAYGGLVTNNGSISVGAYWSHLTDSTIQVTRRANDMFAQQVRVCVTSPDPPDYDSGWVNVPVGVVTPFTHSLGGSVGLYVMRVDTWDPTFGINHRFAGGDVENVMPVGANWQNLDTTSVDVFNRGGPQRARVRIWTTKLVYLPLILGNYTAPTELAYDDGTAESDQSWDQLGNGFAVQFAAPGGAARLTGARFYLNTAAAYHPIQVHVWDDDPGHTDLITPFEATPPAGMGWFDVDLSSYDLTVDGDFYVGFLYAAQHSDPSLGVDTSAADGYSYEVPWEQQTGLDYMIRAVVVSQ